MNLTLDTNILIYAVDDRPTGKQAAGRAMLATLGGRRAPLALQVVGEFQNALHKRLKQPPMLASQQARNALEAFEPFPYHAKDVASALARSAAGQLSYWDALLVASCDATGIDILFSEDMQDAARFGGVTIVNPFAPDGGLSDRARELLEL